MGERTLCHLTTHGKCGLLKAVTDVLYGCSALPRSAHKTRECKVHSLDRIRKVHIPALSCKFLNGRASGVGKSLAPGKLVDRIPNADIESHAKYPVSFVEVPDHLGIGATGIQNNRITASCCIPAYLDVCHTMIYPDEGHTEAEGKGPGSSRHGSKTGAKTWTL